MRLHDAITEALQDNKVWRWTIKCMIQLVKVENGIGIWYTGFLEEEIDGGRPRGDLGQRTLLSEVGENSYFEIELERGLYR